ncbi:hypothetical protein BDY21DRAFT_203329 [Lineolata rhizophorae]|uniref:Zn(2)-C6 fungal-type domain-containing protein n=1 Tax=Lineolata rhizophorae TaxID=578093 RepID=A0A6A6P6Z9_9PEZI|nr:hypothetical protein BDY21DRAFT_203329 [Lineolata rhizophorae]
MEPATLTSAGTAAPAPSGAEATAARSPLATSPATATVNGHSNGHGHGHGHRSSSAAATTTTSATGRPARPAPLACVVCRSRHLKCDGGLPCSRCREDGEDCRYVKSRRGWKGPGRSKARETRAAQAAVENALNGVNVGAVRLPVEQVPVMASTADTTAATTASAGAPVSSTASLPGASANYHVNGNRSPQGLQSPLSSLSDGFSNPLSEGSVASGPAVTSPHCELVRNSPAPPGLVLPANHADLQEKLPNSTQEAFFAFFYPSHPFVLPLARLKDVCRTRHIPCLRIAIEYIGSRYFPNGPTEPLRFELDRALSHPHVVKDGFYVQAALLFAIGLHANDDHVHAERILHQAIATALDIGLNQANYAVMHGGGSRIIEESWRRTWWQLYIVDALFAGFNRKQTFQLQNVTANVPLPCEEADYMSGNIPEPATLEAYDEAVFDNNNTVYSSFAYLIDAVRILGQVLVVAGTSQFDFQAVQTADSRIVNWTFHLPEGKRQIVRTQSRIDEVLFQAHMIISSATILLHRPRSYLGTGEVEEITACVVPGQTLLSTDTKEFHTSKAMQAAEDVSRLIRHPCPIKQHTPFFTCVVVLAAVAHLSYWSFVADGNDAAIKELIRLDVGALKTISDLWPIGKLTLSQVKGVAHEMFVSKRAMSLQYWNSVAAESIFQGMIEEARIDPLDRNSFVDMPAL